MKLYLVLKKIKKMEKFSFKNENQELNCFKSIKSIDFFEIEIVKLDKETKIFLGFSTNSFDGLIIFFFWINSIKY